MMGWFAKYGLDERDIEVKYCTIAAKYYRDRLKARTDSREFSVPEPELEIGS